LLAGEELMKTLITILFFSITANAQMDPRPDLQEQYERSTEPATVEDFDGGLMCAYAIGVDHWMEHQIESYTKTEVTGSYSGKGPRYPGHLGDKKEIKVLIKRGVKAETFLSDSGAKLTADKMDLNWEYAWKSGYEWFSSHFKFRKSGPYLNFTHNVSGGTLGKNAVYYGYCWREKN
jgi:hypothetical protein